MPLTAHGERMKARLTKEYGEKKGTSVLYAMRNSGKLKGIDMISGGRARPRQDVERAARKRKYKGSVDDPMTLG